MKKSNVGKILKKFQRKQVIEITISEFLGCLSELDLLKEGLDRDYMINLMLDNEDKLRKYKGLDFDSVLQKFRDNNYTDEDRKVVEKGLKVGDGNAL